MENYGEFDDGKNFVMAQYHDWLTLTFLDERFRYIIENVGPYRADELNLCADLGCIPGSATYGVIYSTTGRIFELHILNHPAAIHQAFLFAKGKNSRFAGLPNNTLQ